MRGEVQIAGCLRSRGYGIEEIDELLAKLSEAWMLGLGKYIKGD